MIASKWDEASREQLKEDLEFAVLGELRFARFDSAGILEHCRDLYLQDVCPAGEWDAMLAFAKQQIDRNAEVLQAEMADWPKVTDCDRLDQVESELREAGILFWQASPCCDSCTVAELSSRIDQISEQFPRFRQNVRGFAFFIDQNLPESLAESPDITVCLGYGWFSAQAEDIDPAVYESNALAIAHEVDDCLKRFGFESGWDGDFARKICISLCWQRRSLLT